MEKKKNSLLKGIIKVIIREKNNLFMFLDYLDI